MANNDTPTYWKEYLNYVSHYNASMDGLSAKRNREVTEAYHSLPWYKKLLKSTLDERMAIAFDTVHREVTLTGYYNWDVNVRQKKS